MQFATICETLLVLSSLSLGYLVPPNVDSSGAYDLSAIPEGLTENQFKQLIDDTFELMDPPKQKKLSDYKGVEKDTYKLVNDLDDGQHAVFIVYPEDKSGDFDVFFKRDGGSGGGDVESSSNLTNVQRDTFNVENDLEDEDAKLEEFNKLKDDSGKIENDTFNLKNDLDE